MAADLTPEYAKALGRIGGQLLADNLQNFESSQGGDISFDTDLLYLDVANKKIGLNNYGASPAELYVGGTNSLRTVNLKVDNTFTNNNWTISGNTIQVATGGITLAPTGSLGGSSITGALALNGTTQYLTLPAGTAWQLGTGDFTIEWWQYMTSQTANPRVFSVGAYPSAAIAVSIEGGTFYVWEASAFRFSYALTSYLNVWTHFAISRISGTTKVFRDGTQIGSSYADTNNINNTSSVLAVGQESTVTTGSYFPGNITNFRIVKGTGVYSANFTAPTSPLTAISGTQVLLLAASSGALLTDSSSNNFTVTGVGVTYTASAPSAPVATIVASGVGTSGINFTSANGLSAVSTNNDINLTPNGSGITSITGDVSVVGASTLVNISGTGLVSGNLTANGVINIGDASTDTVNFAAELTSDLKPSVTNVDNLGSPSLNWNNLYASTAAGVTSTTTTTLNAGGIQFTGNTISSIDPTKDITFVPQGTGNVKLNTFYPFVGNNVVNSTYQPYNLLSTGDGYWDFNNSTALIIPVGTTAQRINPTLGMLRWNTTLTYLEIYNGTQWQNSIGISASISSSDASDLGVIYDIILG